MKRGERGRGGGGREKRTNSRHSRKDPRFARGAVALGLCGYVLLKYGHEEQILRGFRNKNTGRCALSRSATHEDDEPDCRAGLQQAVAELLIATYNTAHDGAVSIRGLAGRRGQVPYLRDLSPTAPSLHTGKGGVFWYRTYWAIIA